MWCPLCAGEYRSGFSRCAECGVALVNEEPKLPPRLLPERLFADRVYEGRWYGDASMRLFDAAQEAVRSLGLQERLADSSRLVIVASRKRGWFARLFSAYIDIGVLIVEYADGRCLVQVWGQSARAVLRAVRGERGDERLVEQFHKRLRHAL
jgi:hypothetical protein